VGSAERRERERLELRAKILDAARALFVSDGYEAVTMRKIADKIEYSPTAIYIHFHDKAALLKELVADDFAKLAAQFQKIGRVPDPVERLTRSGRAYIEFGLTHPNHYLLMFTIAPPVEYDGSRHAEVKGDPQRDAYAFMRDTVAQAIGEGRFRPELTDVELVAQTLWAGVHGVVSLCIGQSKKDFVAMRKPQQIAELMLEMQMRGLVRDPRG
jgi:AcrR family transcriptional regulator